MSIQYFEGVRVYSVNFGFFRHGAAVTIPGIGIITGSKFAHDEGLLKHEFGHILQYRKWGFLFYWFRIAPVSLLSALKSRINPKFNHMHTWTERSANYLAWRYFDRAKKNCQ